jgi:hypothetical protein
MMLFNPESRIMYLDADVDALLDVTVADLSVNNYTDSRLRDVVDDASLAMVDLGSNVSYCPHFRCASSPSDLVWHALLDGTVGDDIDDISDSELIINSRPEGIGCRLTNL